MANYDAYLIRIKEMKNIYFEILISFLFVGSSLRPVFNVLMHVFVAVSKKCIKKKERKEERMLMKKYC